MVGNTSTTLAAYDLGTSTSSAISITNGTVYIQLANTGASGPRDYRFQSGSGITAVSGGTVQFGNSSSGTAKLFNAVGVFPTLIIDNTSAGHTLTLGTPATYNHISRSVTINTGCTFNIGSNPYLFSGTTFTNNGTFTGTGASSNFVFYGAGMLRPADNFKNNSNTEEMTSLFVDGASYNEFLKNGYDSNLPIEIGPQTWTGTGVVTTMTNFAVQNTSGVILTPTNNIVCRNIRLFEGGVTGADKLTLGNGDATGNVIQFGNTTTFTDAGSFDVAPSFNLGTGGETISYLRTGASRTAGNEINPGRVLTALTYDDTASSHSLTIAGGALSVGTLNVTNGKINGTAANLLTVTGTTAASVTGGSATAYVNGPLVRTFRASLVAGTTYNYPLGKGSYNPLALVDAVTGAGGPVVIQSEVFDANSGGTPGNGMASLNTNRYWSANINSGGADFTSTKIRLTDAGLTSTMGIAKSSTVGGIYDLISSNPPAAGVVTSDDITSLSFFNLGQRILVNDPTGVSATSVSNSQINVAFTPNGASNNVLIVWNTTGTFSAPVGAPPAIGQPFAGGEVLYYGTGSPVNHTSLTGATTYYYKLFSYDLTDYSIGVAVNATTYGSLPYSQDFEGTTPTVFPPSGWLNTSAKLWTHSPAGGVGGSKGARVSYSPAGTATLQMPTFVLPASPDQRVKFQWRDEDDFTKNNPSPKGDEIEIVGNDTTYFEISTNGGSIYGLF